VDPVSRSALWLAVLHTSIIDDPNKFKVIYTKICIQFQNNTDSCIHIIFLIKTSSIMNMFSKKNTRTHGSTRCTVKVPFTELFVHKLEPPHHIANNLP
jgi:hypothetical protein